MGDFNDFIHAQSSKATPVDADEVPLLDSASSFASARLTWANLKATLKTYFDTLYPTILKSYLAATVTYNNTNTLASTALSVTVAASTKYDIELTIHSTSAGAGLNMDFAGTATITNFIGQWTAWQAGIDESGPSRIRGDRVTAAGTDYGPGALDGIDALYTFKGSVEINGAGTFLLRGAQNAAAPSDTTILRGSTLVLTKLA
jgi:hypothetical protein